MTRRRVRPERRIPPTEHVARRGSRVASWIAVGVALVAVGVGVQRFVLIQRGGPAGPKATDGLNVLLITLDTTRADHLGCYGATPSRTPNLDRLAQSGVLFRQCSTCSPQTLPSHCSIMTGVTPFVHGVRRNQSMPLPPSAVTLAKSLRAAGLNTQAAVSSCVLDKSFGIDQGFQVYHEIPRGVDSRGLPLVERRGDETCNDALGLLAAVAKKRFFLWVHFFDPHHPYVSERTKDIDAPEAYTDEVAFMDTQVGRLLDELRRLGLEQRTLIVVLGDHGEGLGDHDEYQHGFFVYESTMHVPLLMSCPDVFPAGRQVAAQVRTIDVAPTILDFASAAPLPSIQGVSLRPLLLGQKEDLGLEAYGEATEAQTVFGLSRLRSLTAAGWKYILSPAPELYDLRTDPGERADRAAADAQRAAAARDRLRAVIAGAPEPFPADAADAPPSPAQIARLESLGYIGTASTPSSKPEPELDLFEPTEGNPRDHAATIGLALHAHRAWVLREYAAAEGMLRRVLDELPKAPDMWRDLAFALEKQGKSAEAIPVYERTLALTPDDASTRQHYALMLLAMQRWDDAIREGQRVIRTMPTDSSAYAILGTAYSQLGQFAEAEQNYSAAVQHDPRNVAALFGLGAVYRQQHRLPEAADCFRRMLAVDPSSAPARQALQAVEAEMK